MKKIFSSLIATLIFLANISSPSIATTQATISSPSITTTQTTELNDNWDLYSDLSQITGLKLNLAETQNFFINDQLYIATVHEGAILIYTFVNNSFWQKVQHLTATDVKFNTIKVADVVGDTSPEIIAGTDEPGFLYLYILDETSENWLLANNSKYVWSSITQIMIGNFSDNTTELDFLVQNSAGELFFFQNTINSLDIIWKSPTAWKPISSYLVMDFDNDFIDEILVVYKSGGIAVLKVQNNKVNPIWENYPWGKVLSLTAGDWNGDDLFEAVIATSRNIVFTLNYDLESDSYVFLQEKHNFGYTIENLCYIDNIYKQWIATDLSGRLHLIEYNLDEKRWNERQQLQSGRIAKSFTTSTATSVWLWGVNSQLVLLSREAKVSADNSIVPEPEEINLNVETEQPVTDENSTVSPIVPKTDLETTNVVEDTVTNPTSTNNQVDAENVDTETPAVEEATKEATKEAEKAGETKGKKSWWQRLKSK